MFYVLAFLFHTAVLAAVLRALRGAPRVRPCGACKGTGRVNLNRSATMSRCTTCQGWGRLSGADY